MQYYKIMYIFEYVNSLFIAHRAQLTVIKLGITSGHDAITETSVFNIKQIDTSIKPFANICMQYLATSNNGLEKASGRFS